MCLCVRVRACMRVCACVCMRVVMYAFLTIVLCTRMPPAKAQTSNLLVLHAPLYAIAHAMPLCLWLMSWLAATV